MLNVCITFDYEIFFGKNYFNDEQILFEPTNKLLEILNKYNVSATFFADVCSVSRHKELGLELYPERFKNQLIDLSLNKQDIQLHIHPHWYNSKFVDHNWIFDNNSYSINNFPYAKENNNLLTVEKIIREGKEYLESLLKSINKSYQCIAYRAGGFSIQPEEKLFNTLIGMGIKIDSSVANGLEAKDEINAYSFKKTPSCAHWWVNPTIGVKKEGIASNENILEISVATIQDRPKKWFLSLSNAYHKKKVKYELRGTYMSPQKHVKKSKLRHALTLIEKRWNNPIIVSLDAYDAKVLWGCLKHLFKKYKAENHDVFITIIGHPKLMNEERLQNFEAFLKLYEKNKNNIRFVTMADIYNSCIKTL
jgi:hypothetical protein